MIVIEHNLDVVAHADWVIDLGPDGGDAGGAVVFEGPPSALVTAVGSVTGEHLTRYLGAAPVPGESTGPTAAGFLLADPPWVAGSRVAPDTPEALELLTNPTRPPTVSVVARG